ncbi:MAG: secretin N-terminal domain-containing protein [Gemmatimonadaceae bacterium]
MRRPFAGLQFKQSRRRWSLREAIVASLLCCLVLSRNAASQSQQGVRLDFRDAPLAEVIRSIAGMMGLSVVADVPADKRISFSSPTPVAQAQLGAVLEGILETNGLVLVQRGSIAQVFPADKAPKTGQVGFGITMSDPPPLGLVTQLVPLQSIRADEGAAALKQVAGVGASIEAVVRSNSLLITDRGVNVAKYLELLRRLDDKPQGEAGLRTYVVPLKYANADDLAESLGSLFGVQVPNGRRRSLDDRSLSRALDSFRDRESDAFRMRREVSPATGTVSATGGTRDSASSNGALVGQTTVVPHSPSNSLLIRTSPPNFPLLQETIQALDLRPSQVLLEVTVVEVTLGTGDQFGVDWRSVGGSSDISSGNPASTDSSSLRDLAIRVVTLRNANVRAILRALSSRSQVRVLSTPSILASNNQESHILVGSRVPFVASTRLGNDVAIDRQVQFEEVGTSLTIVPTINQDDYVSVQILQEVSSLTNQTIQAALNAPVISTREAVTRTVIRDGQTVVIAGLIGDSREKIESGIPLLKDIPLLGALFRRTSETRSRSEVAIFVTPYIVRTDAEADVIRERVQKRLNTSSPGILPDSMKKRP